MDDLYVRINKLDETLSGILFVSLSDHLPIFIYMGRKTKRKPKLPLFKCRKLDDNAFKNIKSLLCFTDLSWLHNFGVEEPYEKFVDIIHENTDTYMQH